MGLPRKSIDRLQLYSELCSETANKNKKEGTHHSSLGWTTLAPRPPESILKSFYLFINLSMAKGRPSSQTPCCFMFLHKLLDLLLQACWVSVTFLQKKTGDAAFFNHCFSCLPPFNLDMFLKSVFFLLSL